MGVQHAGSQTVAKKRKGDPSDPAENRIFREKGISYMVHRHGNDGDQFDKIGITGNFTNRLVFMSISETIWYYEVGIYLLKMCEIYI